MPKKNKNKKGKASEGQKSESMSLLVVSSNTANTISPDLHIVGFESSTPNSKDCIPWDVLTIGLPPKWDYSKMNPKALIYSNIPTVEPTTGNGTACVLYARTKHRLSSITPGFFCLERDADNRSDPPYEIRSAGSKGIGMFATRALDIGDLIFIDMPLVILPIPADLSQATFPEIDDHRVEAVRNQKATLSMLEMSFDHMTKEDQDVYLGLTAGHWGREAASLELLHIWKANVFEMSGLQMGCEEDRYGAVLKLLSKVNHCCHPNCAHTFSPDSFTLELRASRKIAAGEEILYSYCDPCTPTSSRQSFLNRNHGFSCSCLSCIPGSDADANDAIRCSIPSRMTELTRLWNIMPPPTLSNIQTSYADTLHIYETTNLLMRDMEREGLDGYGLYLDAVQIRFSVCLVMADIMGLRGDLIGLMRWKEEGRRYVEKMARCNFAADGSYEMKRKHEDQQSRGINFNFGRVELQ